MLIFILSFLLLSLIFAYTLLIQCYLAKYQPNSCLYWRNHLFLANSLFLLTKNKLLDLFALAIGSLSVLMIEGCHFKHLWIAIYRIPTLIRLEKIFHLLDDVIDNASTNDILSMHESMFTPLLEPFLNNAEATAFFQILVEKIHQQANIFNQHAQEENLKNAALLREKIARINIELTGFFCAIIMHMIKRDPRVAQSATTKKFFTYAQLKEIYPVALKTGELLQILHDTHGFISDFNDENSTEKISQNYFLAQLDKQGLLAIVEEKLIPQPKRAQGFYELPQKVQTAFLELQHEYVSKVFSIHPFFGLICTLAWEYRFRVGFY